VYSRPLAAIFATTHNLKVPGPPAVGHGSWLNNMGLFSSNLKKPKGLFGRFISIALKKNLVEYYGLEEFLKIKNGMTLLEIGYGPGYGIKHFLTKYDINIDGIDFSKLMYKTANGRNRKYENRINLICGDFNTEEIQLNKYDVVYLLNVIYFWDNPKKEICKIYGTLKKNGKIAIGMADAEYLKNSPLNETKEFNIYDLQEIKELLAKNGFINVQICANKKVRNCFYIIGEK
jgi:SAM-dependent methyltransferase